METATLPYILPSLPSPLTLSPPLSLILIHSHSLSLTLTHSTLTLIYFHSLSLTHFSHYPSTLSPHSYILTNSFPFFTLSHIPYPSLLSHFPSHLLPSKLSPHLQFYHSLTTNLLTILPLTHHSPTHLPPSTFHLLTTFPLTYHYPLFNHSLTHHSSNSSLSC